MFLMRHLYRVVRLWSGCDHDVCPGPKATRLREYRVSEKMSQRIELPPEPLADRFGIIHKSRPFE